MDKEKLESGLYMTQYMVQVFRKLLSESGILTNTELDLAE